MDAVRRAIRDSGATAVMHFAAWLSVPDSVRDPAGYYRNNVTGTLGDARGDGGGRLPAVRVLVDMRRLRRAGRDADQRNASDGADQRLRTDQAGDRARAAALRARLRHPVDPAALLQRGGRRSGRRAWRGSRAGDSRHSARDRGGARRPPIDIFGEDYPTPDGTCLRDYIHVTDLADAHMRALGWLQAGGASASYNVGTERPSSVKDVIAAVERVTGLPVTRRSAPRRAGDPAVLYASAAADPPGPGLGRPARRSRHHRARRLALARHASARLWDGRPLRRRSRRMTRDALYRLLRYARPYRGAAGRRCGGDGVYGAASAGVATLIRPIFDEVLPTREHLLPITLAILVVYFLKGLGAYLSSLSDDRRRAARRPRSAQRVVPAHARPVGRVLLAADDRPADVADHQRRRRRCSARCRRRSATSRASRWRSWSSWRADLLRRAAGARLPHRRAARRLSAGAFGQRVRRTTRRSQEALEQMSHVSAEAFTGHRIVKAFGAEAREAAKFERGVGAVLSHEHAGDQRAVACCRR